MTTLEKEWASSLIFFLICSFQSTIQFGVNMTKTSYSFILV